MSDKPEVGHYPCYNDDWTRTEPDLALYLPEYSDDDGHTWIDGKVDIPYRTDAMLADMEMSSP